ncbi:MAG: (2Fe-2S)-binding protein [Actinomycetota bacterium]|nr:(2Fe-2S)-binding protein [Actinomycetota bacterium]
MWLAPERAAVPTPPRPTGDTVPEPVPAPPAPHGPVLGNLDPALESAWHPVALSTQLRPGGWLQARLLGRTWTLRRTDHREVDPPAYGVRERLAVMWLAPAEPRDVPLEVPEDGDRRFIPGWLLPQRSAGTAGVLADAFLDVAHFRFLHAGSFGAADHVQVPAYEVEAEPGGFRSVHEQWFDNVTDPGVATGERPLRQRRRATYVYRAPFQLLLRLDFLDSGAVTTIQFLLQPEDPDSTRVYTRLLLSSGPGNPLPAPADVEREVAFAHRVLQEDLALTAHMAGQGLPLAARDEMHVRADRLGVALRRALCDFVVSAPRRDCSAA